MLLSVGRTSRGFVSHSFGGIGICLGEARVVPKSRCRVGGLDLGHGFPRVHGGLDWGHGFPRVHVMSCLNLSLRFVWLVRFVGFGSRTFFSKGASCAFAARELSMSSRRMASAASSLSESASLSSSFTATSFSLAVFTFCLASSLSLSFSLRSA